MLDSIFRLYDIRGKVSSELLLDEVYNLGRAIATFFLQRNRDVKTVVLGADGRIHSPIIKKEISRALQDAGLDVISIGVCPTPVMYFSVHTLPVQAGLMITASHNTKEYNGIKICLGTASVWGEQIQEIKRIYKEKHVIKRNGQGSQREYDVITDYITWLVHHFQDLISYDISVIFDCAHGAAGTVMPRLIEAMKWPNAQLLFERVDGEFPAHEADPTAEKNMQDLKKKVISSGADLGIGFDGDCDRMAPVTATGKLVLGDLLLALFAQAFLKKNPGARIVFDIKCSSGLIKMIQASGGIPCMSATGHSIIKNRMKQEGSLLGGELSCHFFFADEYFGYDDGIYAALRLLRLLKKSSVSLDTLISQIPHSFSTPEIRIECPNTNTQMIIEKVKQAFMGQPGVELTTLDGVRVSKPYGWGLVRASHTQPAISLRFESDSQEGLRHIQDDFLNILQDYVDQKELKRHFYG